MTSGGGWKAITYTLRTAQQVGWLKLWRAMRSRNACKTCALGMGGQRGGMVNEAGHFPEVCKKSLQAMAADMQNGIASEFFARYSLSQLRSLSPRELEACGRLVDPIYAGPGDSHYRVIAWDEALDRLSRNLTASGPNSQFLLRQRPVVERGGIPAAVAGAGVWNEQRQQLFLLLPSGERRRTDGQPRHGYCHRTTRRRRAQRSLRPHRWQSSFEPSTPAANVDGAAAPRRPRHRHQPGQRSRSGELSRAQRSTQPAVR